jgi:hypothetical protein
MIATGRKDDESGSIIFSTSRPSVYPSTLSRLSAMIKRESGSHVTATARKIGFPRNYFRARSLPILFSARENSFRRIKC